MYSIEFFYSITFIPRKNLIIIIIIIQFISYIRVVYNNKVSSYMLRQYDASIDVIIRFIYFLAFSNEIKL